MTGASRPRSRRLALARCVRVHATTSFPDPAAGGRGTGMNRGGIDPNSPQFRAAQQACHARLLTKGGTKP